MPNIHSSGYVSNLKISFNKISYFLSVDSEIKVIVHPNYLIIYSPTSFHSNHDFLASVDFHKMAKLWVNFTFNVDSLVAHQDVQEFDLYVMFRDDKLK